MYLVNTNQFIEYLQNKSLLGKQFIDKAVPCLIEFKVGEIILAKVEVLSFAEFQNVYNLNKHPKTVKNKYWIRGQEWEKDSEGNLIQKLKL